MNIQQYIDNLNRRFQTGISREHAYRGDLQLFLETLLNDIQVINEPARIACGAPDYILMKKDIPVGYIDVSIHSCLYCGCHCQYFLAGDMEILCTTTKIILKINKVPGEVLLLTGNKSVYIFYYES